MCPFCMPIPLHLPSSFYLGAVLGTSLLLLVVNALRRKRIHRVEQINLTHKDHMHRQELKTHERFLTAMNAVEDGLWDFDLQTGNIYISHAWARMLGYEHKPAYLSVDEWSVLVHPEDIENAYSRLNDHVRGKTGIYESEYRIKSGRGEWVWIGSRGKLIKDAYGAPMRVVGIHHDIQQKKLSEQAMQRAFDTEKRLSRLKSDFVTMLSHELRTPLTVLVSSRALLGASLESGVITRGSLCRYLNQMDGSISRLRTLVEEALAYVHIESTMDQPYIGQVDIVALVNRAVEEVKVDSKIPQDKAPTFVVRCPKGLSFSKLDEVSLHQVLKHLLLHIVQCSSELKTLDIDVADSDKAISITVSERAISKFKAQLDMFEHSGSVPVRTETAIDQLGLVIIRRLIERMGGTMTIGQPAQGFSICIEIPKGL